MNTVIAQSSEVRAPHPAVALIAFLCCASIAAAGSKVDLLGLLLACGALIVWQSKRRALAQRALRQLLRLRLFFLALALCYGFATPGTPLVAALPERYAPTVPGLAAAGLQAARLAALVVALVATTGTLAPSAVVSGLRTLLRPLRHLGLPVDRLALRLALTLQYVEELGTKVSWHDLLRVESMDYAPVPADMATEQRMWTSRDSVLSAALFCITVVALLVGG